MRLQSNVRMRFWVEAGLASLSGALAILTLMCQDWIEALTSFEPDARSGSFEWAIVAGTVMTSIVLALAGRSEWLRARSAMGTA